VVYNKDNKNKEGGTDQRAHNFVSSVR